MTRQLSFDEIGLVPDPVVETDADLFVVNVIRSAKRKKSSQARLKGSELEIRVPSWISSSQEREIVDHFVDKFRRSHQAELVDLTERAAELAERHGFPHASSIRWVANQEQRWGSCTPAHGTIRISDRLAKYPSWVLDYVIVHELAHLLEENHSPQFWELVGRYPLSERARGFLIAKSSDGE